MKNCLYVVIPCYNEEEVLPETVKRLSSKFDSLIKNKLISKDSKVLLVNDGSKDNTWALIKGYYQSNKYICGIALSRNRGHQNALLAGLDTASNYADMIISMDADLQDDINAIDKFILEYNNGSEIVYGVRSSRKKDTWFKRNTAQMYYKFMKALGVEIVYNHADYRLMSKRAVKELMNFKEVNLFLRGIVPLLGFKSSIVTYERAERFAGESKYPLRKMVNLAIEGILSFSVKPIRIITSTGFVLSFVSFIYLLYVLISYFVTKASIVGWTTTTVLICLFGSFQIFCIGIIGEYVGKIYLETKRRPRFILSEELIK